MNKSPEKIAYKVSAVTIALNIILALFKCVAGILGNSAAMLSDAVHSASDVISTFVVIVGVKFSSKKSDEDHPYGHERFECVASILLATLLALTGLGIGVTAIDKIKQGITGEIPSPGIVALVAAIISIIVKEWMYHYTMIASKKINSGSLKADAWHHRSDALSSIGSFVGIFGAILGVPVLDPITSVVICVFILKVAFDIFKDAVDKMVDKACDKNLIDEFRKTIMASEGVINIDEIKTRVFGAKIYVDVEILVDGTKSLLKSNGLLNPLRKIKIHVLPEVSAERVINTDMKELMDEVRDNMIEKLNQIRAEK